MTRRIKTGSSASPPEAVSVERSRTLDSRGRLLEPRLWPHRLLGVLVLQLQRWGLALETQSLQRRPCSGHLLRGRSSLSSARRTHDGCRPPSNRVEVAGQPRPALRGPQGSDWNLGHQRSSPLGGKRRFPFCSRALGVLSCLPEALMAAAAPQARASVYPLISS